jgi:hypothetical protein
MNREGIMGLPSMGEREQVQTPYDDPQTQAVYEDLRANVSPKQFSSEMLNSMSEMDAQTTEGFLAQLEAANLPPEVIQALEDLVQVIFENPGDYAEIRSLAIQEGVPEEILPESFDIDFFTMFKMALDSLTPDMPSQPPLRMAKGGLASLPPPQMKQMAQAMQSMGREGDTILAHINPQEAGILKALGGSGTINPRTGLPEFKLLKKIGKALGGAAKSVVKAAGSIIKAVAKPVINVVKGLASSVKKVAQSTVGKIAIAAAAAFFLGPAAATMLAKGATALGASAAVSGAIMSGVGVASVQGFVGNFTASALSGAKLSDSLKAGATGALTAGAMAGISGGSAAFQPNSYTGPTTISGQWDRFTGAAPAQAVTPSPAATGIEGFGAAADQVGGAGFPQAVPDGIPVPPWEGTSVPIAPETFAATAPANAPIEAPLSAATAPVRTPLTGTEGFGAAADQVGGAGFGGYTPNVTGIEGFGAAADQVGGLPIEGYDYKPTSLPTPPVSGGGTTASGESPGILDRAKTFYENPSLDNFQNILVDPNAKTLLGQYGPLAGAGLLTTAALGGFKAPPTDPTPLDFDPMTGEKIGGPSFKEQRPDLFADDRKLSEPGFQLSETIVEPPRYGVMPQRGASPYSAPAFTLQPGGIPQPYNREGMYGIPMLYMAKSGSGIMGVEKFPRKTGPINGPGTGTSDSIPAMLSDGEFVFTAKAVRNMGNGSRRKGAARMYKMMKMLEGGPVGAAAKKG